MTAWLGQAERDRAQEALTAGRQLAASLAADRRRTGGQVRGMDAVAWARWVDSKARGRGGRGRAFWGM